MVDETGYADAPPKPKTGIRTAVMSSLSVGQFSLAILDGGPIRRMTNLGWILRWGMVHGMSSKRRTPMKVDELVEQWIEAVAGMCAAHDKDSYDAHDAKADELLGPLLAAPVKQVREFYHKLRERMKADKRVPFLVWIGFEAWGEVAVKDAPDEGVKRLKAKLAGEIADLVEEPVRDQIPEAIKRALKWRDPETLKEVKAALKSGAKPKLVGRESCLFLEMKKNGKKFSVML